MDKSVQSKFIAKHKKTILFSVGIILAIALCLFGFYEYNKNITENKKNIGIDLFKSGDYDGSTEKLNDYLKSVQEDTQVREILNIISIYSNSKESFDKGNFDLVMSTLETMPEKANDYPIKTKIDELKNSTIEAIKKNEISTELVKLGELITSKDYNLAKDIIIKLETMELSDENDLAELAKNKKIVEDYYTEEKVKELVANNVESKPNNKPENGSNSSSTQPYIAYTSTAKTSSQIITVTSTGGSNGELVMWQKDSDGIWKEYDRMYARLGSGGMKAASEVYEMDMCTPTGAYSLTEAFGVAGNPGSGVPYRKLDGSEYWIDDPDSSFYNTMQFGEPNGRWKSAEHLIEHPNSYKYSLVIDYNRSPVIPGKSSAIFLHVDVGVPTWGCVAVAENKMVKILNWVDGSSNPKIILGFTENYITNF